MPIDKSQLCAARMYIVAERGSRQTNKGETRYGNCRKTLHWRKNISWQNIKTKLATYFRKHKTKTDQFARIEIIVYENHIFKMKKMLKHNYVDII